MSRDEKLTTLVEREAGVAKPIQNTLRADSPHRVLLYDLQGNLVREEQRETLWDCQREAVDHVRSLAPEPTGYRILWTNTEPDHFKLELQGDTAEGRIVGSPLAWIEPPWMTTKARSE